MGLLRETNPHIIGRFDYPILLVHQQAVVAQPAGVEPSCTRIATHIALSFASEGGSLCLSPIEISGWVGLVLLQIL